MSRKRKRPQSTRPWPILLFGGVVLLEAVLLFANKAGGAGGGGSSAGGAPHMVVDPAKIDYGYVKFGNDEDVQDQGFQYRRWGPAFQRAAVY